MEWIGLVVVVLALSWWVVQGETGPGSRGRRATVPASPSAEADTGTQKRPTEDDRSRTVSSEFRSAQGDPPRASAYGEQSGEERSRQAAATDASEAQAADFATVARESGWFVDPVPQWLVDAAEEWLASSKSSVVPLRNTGEPLSKEEKRALGVNVNAKLGRDYINALSDSGRAECPLRALETCLERARSRRGEKR